MDYNGTCKEFWDTNTSQIQAGGIAGSSGPLTSDDYEIVDLEFAVSGDGADSSQPKVTILMEIQDKNLPDKPRIKIQTTVSQRNLDL